MLQKLHKMTKNINNGINKYIVNVAGVSNVPR